MKIIRRKKPASPAQRPSEAELFTDREEFIDVFEEALNKLTNEYPKALVFHGGPGIGKSEIKKELIRRLNKKRDAVTDHEGAPVEENDDYRTIWAGIDFNSPEYRTPDRGLLKLRNDLLHDRVWQIPFRTFDIGFAIRWRKTNPELPLNLETLPGLNDSRIIKDVLELGGEIFPGVKLVAGLTRIMKTATGELKDWWTVSKSETLQQLEEAEPYEIDEALPGLFADDLKYFSRREKVRVVIFLDAYEKLWRTEEDRSAHRYHAIDAWVRDLVCAAPGVLWVITGHDDVCWREVQDNRIECSEVVTSKHVESLTESDCNTLLERAGITDEPIKEKIYRGSHGVPLYIDLSIDTYYDAITKREQPGPGDFGGTYEEIFNRFVERLSREEALTLVAIGPARSFDAQLFKAVVDHFGTAFPTAAFDDFVRFSFMRQGDAPGTYRVHDLLREHVEKYSDEERNKEVHRFLFDYYKTRAEVDDPKAITDENLHALAEGLYHGLETGEVAETAEWLNVAYEIFYDAALYGEVTPLLEELKYAVEKKLGPDHADVAATLHNLAGLYEEQGRYEEAEPLYQRSLDIKEKALGHDHSSVADTLSDLARLHHRQGRYDEAEPLYERSLKITKKALGADHADVAATLDDLAALYHSQGRYVEAEPLYQRDLEITEKALGPDHLEVATALNNLARLYNAQGRYVEAEPLYRRSLEINEKGRGPDHPSVAIVLANLAGLYRNQGRYYAAVPLFVRSLYIFEKSLGPDHPSVGATLNNLAELYRAQGRYDEAEPLYQRSLDIKEKALGPDHPDVATSLNNLGLLFYKTDRKNESIAYLERALLILNSALPPNHPNTITVLESLAEIHAETGDQEKAAEYARRVEELKKSREDEK